MGRNFKGVCLCSVCFYQSLPSLCIGHAAWIKLIELKHHWQKILPPFIKCWELHCKVQFWQRCFKLCRKELEELSDRLQVERDRYQVTSQDESAISAMPQFSINDKFILNQEDASYVLSLEVQSPIDYVLLQVWYIFYTIPYHTIRCSTILY